ncbi:MAG: hypothetical protein ACPGPD_13395 [Pseudomonadales bacterium]
MTDRLRIVNGSGMKASSNLPAGSHIRIDAARTVSIFEAKLREKLIPLMETPAKEQSK